MKNSADQGGCYPQRPKAEVNNSLRDLQNSYPMKAEFNNKLLLYYSSKIFTCSLKEFRHFALCFSAHQIKHNLVPRFSWSTVQ